MLCDERGCRLDAVEVCVPVNVPPQAEGEWFEHKCTIAQVSPDIRSDLATEAEREEPNGGCFLGRDAWQEVDGGSACGEAKWL